jgi:predicted MFS family arabinose efflux permease
LAAFTTAHFSHHISNSILNPLLPYIRDSFSLSYGESGGLVSAFAISLGLSNAPIGALSDRLGPRRVVVGGLVLTTVVGVALATSGSYWQLLGFLVLLGIVSGTYHAPASALIARTYPSTSRGAAMGLHITGGHLAFFVAPAVAAWLITITGSWTTPYLWLAFAPVLAAVWLWRIAPADPDGSAAPLDLLAVFRDLGTVVRGVGLVVSASLMFQVAQAALFAFLTLYLVDVRGIDPALAAVYFGAPQLVGLVGSPLAGWLSDRVGRRTVILIALAVQGPAFLALSVVPASFTLLPLLAIGLSAAMRQVPTEVLVMDAAPPHRRATALGSYHLLVQQSGGIAAPALGAAAGAVGIDLAFSSICIGLGAASTALVALALVRRSR